MLKLAFIGGDQREYFLIEELHRQKYQLFGYGELAGHLPLTPINDIETLIKQSDIIIGPMAGTDKEGWLQAAFPGGKLQLNQQFFSFFNNKQLLLIGMLPQTIFELGKKQGVNIIKTGALAEIAILNAIPTAEGAIKIAIANTDHCLFQAQIIVLGFGNVAKALSRRLKALGAIVSVVCRGEANQARAIEMGLLGIDIAKLKTVLASADLIFNTIPHQVLTATELKACSPKAVLIDLASDPGGIDENSAAKYGLKLIRALGLPGKTAPQTAGQILAKSYPALFEKYYIKNRQ